MRLPIIEADGRVKRDYVLSHRSIASLTSGSNL
jgi:hypothetical protein